MEIEFIFPTLQYRLNPPAIYRLDFNNGYYYIGSSMKVKNRIKSWRTNLKCDRFQSRLMEHSIKGATSVVASILEICSVPNSKALKERETEYLLTCFNDPLFLNMTPSGLNNEGMTFKVLPEQLIKPPKEKRPYIRGGKPKPRVRKEVYAFAKGIVQFDLNGNYIQSHKSISDAARAIGVEMKTVQKHLKVKRHRIGLSGFIFKFCGDNSPIELLVKKEAVVNENSGKVKSKVVIDTKTGEEITVEIAAQRLGLTKKYFYKIISESDGKVNNTQYRYGEGYIWKYA